MKTLSITGVTPQGDGIADHQDQSYVIPYTLPGDVIVLTFNDATKSNSALPQSFDDILLENDHIDFIKESSERQTPPCKHFGRCGGCRLQHMNEDLYRNFKRVCVEQALKNHGVVMNSED